MPTTINTSDLTIITRELITLGGNQYDSKHTQIIPNIKEVTKRLITVPTASIGATDTVEGVEIFKVTSTLLTGPYKESDVRYIRITNLDDTNFVTLQLHNDQGDETAKKLDYGSTYFYNCDIFWLLFGPQFENLSFFFIFCFILKPYICFHRISTLKI